VLDIVLDASKEIIQAYDVFPFAKQAIAEVGTEKSGSTSHKDTWTVGVFVHLK